MRKLELETVSIDDASALERIKYIWFSQWCNRPASYLLGINTSAKIIKGRRQALTGILYLSPNDQSGINVCPYSSEGCVKDCLVDSGRLWMETVAKEATGQPTARLLRTWEYLADRKSFTARLYDELAKLRRKATKLHRRAACRLNGTSDLVWYDVIRDHPNITFYDYTKSLNRYIDYLKGRLPRNYHLTYSASEHTNIGEWFHDVAQWLPGGQYLGTIAIPFNPSAYANILSDRYFIDNYGMKIPVYDGDKTDNRFLDDRLGIIALKAKGKKWKANCTGFVRDYLNQSGMIV
jgi:hypothetical protein